MTHGGFWWEVSGFFACFSDRRIRWRFLVFPTFGKIGGFKKYRRQVRESLRFWRG